jgi:CBS domain-containing protein
MKSKNISALPVFTGDRLAGIVTERDFVRYFTSADRPLTEARVSDIMTRSIISIGPEHNVADCMSLMIEHHIRHLIVCEKGMLAGILSMRDIVAELLAEKNFIIEQMHCYILGAYTTKPERNTA